MNEKRSEITYKDTLINIQTANEIIQKLITIPTNRHVELKLESCTITNEGIYFIAQALENNSISIEHLSIMGIDDENHLSNLGIRTLLQALIHNKTLKMLFIGDNFNPIWDEDSVNLLTEIFKKNTSLHYLTIHNLKLHDQDNIPVNEALMLALKDNTTLESFTFWDTGLNQEDSNKIKAYISRNSALSVFYKNYHIYMDDQEEYNYNFPYVCEFIQQNWVINDHYIITDNYKLIELHHFTQLHTCFKNFSESPENHLDKIVHLLTIINENPSQQFARALRYVLKEFMASDLYSHFELKLFLLETLQKMGTVCFIPEFASYEISCILGDLDLRAKHSTVYERRQCYQRIVDILAPQCGHLPLDLQTYLLAAASALENGSCEASLNSLSSKQITVFAWTMDELNSCCEELNINLNARLSRLEFMNKFYEAILECPLPEALKETLGSNLYNKLSELKENLKNGQEVKAVFPSQEEEKLEIASEVLNFFREVWNLEIPNYHLCN